MSECKNILSMLDRDDPTPDPLDNLQPFMRFDWRSLTSSPWPSDRHPVDCDAWTIRLPCRDVRLIEFHQFSVYEGLLAGIPTHTAQFAWQALQKANSLIPHLMPTLMLEPVLREFEYPNASGEGAANGLVLPPIASVAVFRSSSIESTPDDAYSILKAVWFQETFGLPEDLHTLAQLRAIDWENEAAGWMP